MTDAPSDGDPASGERPVPAPPLTVWARCRPWLPLLLMLAAGAAVYLTGAYRYVGLESLRASHDELRAYVDAHFWLGLVLFMCVFAAATFVAVPGAVVLQLLAGFLFGPWVGGAATAAAATVGSLGYYWAARKALGESLRLRALADPRARRWREGLEKDAFWYLLGLRVPPVMLFVGISALAGLAAVPPRTYLAATFIGVLPSATVYAAVGSGLKRVFEPGQALNLMVPEIMGPLLGLGLLSLLPAAFKLTLHLRRRRSDPA